MGEKLDKDKKAQQTILSYYKNALIVYEILSFYLPFFSLLEYLCSFVYFVVVVVVFPNSDLLRIYFIESIVLGSRI